MNNSDVLCKLRMLCSLVSCTICVQYCTTKCIGLQLSGHVWQRCNNSNILHCNTNSIRAMYCTILQPFVPCMWGSALGYWHVWDTVPLKKYWFVYFTACIRLHLAHWSAGTESKWHVSVTSPSPTNQDPLSVLWLTGRACAPGCGFLRAEAAQETGGRGMSVGVISMLLGLAELSEFCLIYVRDALWAGPEGCRGSRGERCGEGLSSWDCCDVVGIVRECWSIDLFIVLRVALRVRCSYSAVPLLWHTLNW